MILKFSSRNRKSQPNPTTGGAIPHRPTRNKNKLMHYINGRLAQDGDFVVIISGGSPQNPPAFQAGRIHSLNANASTCNGQVAVPTYGGCTHTYVTLSTDVLHAEDAMTYFMCSDSETRPIEEVQRTLFRLGTCPENLLAKTRERLALIKQGMANAELEEGVSVAAGGMSTEAFENRVNEQKGFAPKQEIDGLKPSCPEA